MITRKLCRFITWICLCWLPWHTVESHYFGGGKAGLWSYILRQHFCIVKITLGNPFQKPRIIENSCLLGGAPEQVVGLHLGAILTVLKSLDPRITLLVWYSPGGNARVWSWGAVHSAFPSTPSIADQGAWCTLLCSFVFLVWTVEFQEVNEHVMWFCYFISS